MKKILILIMLFMIFNICTGEEKEMLLGASWTFPPFQMLEDKKPRGIMYDVYKEILESMGYKGNYKEVPRKRSRSFLERGEIFATLSSFDWEKNPEAFLWSDPVISLEDILIGKDKKTEEIKVVEDLYGSIISTHLGYVYPELEDSFKSEKIKRSDAPYEKAIILKVLYNRSDYGIVEKYVYLWMKKHLDLDCDLYMSKRNFGCTEYRYIFNKKDKKLVDEFNKKLKKLKEIGELDEIINSYIK